MNCLHIRKQELRNTFLTPVAMKRHYSKTHIILIGPYTIYIDANSEDRFSTICMPEPPLHRAIEYCSIFGNKHDVINSARGKYNDIEKQRHQMLFLFVDCRQPADKPADTRRSAIKILLSPKFVWDWRLRVDASWESKKKFSVVKRTDLISGVCCLASQKKKKKNFRRNLWSLITRRENRD